MKTLGNADSSARWSIFLMLLCAVAFSASALAAGDPWTTKSYLKWTNKDIAAILQSSPWAQTEIQAIEAGHSGDASPITDQFSVTSAGDETWGTLTVPPDYITGPALNTEPRNYEILWLSARTIRAAFAQEAVLRGKMTQKDAAKLVAQPQDYYTILVRGPQLNLLQKRGENALKDLAYLQIPREKSKIHPSRVTFWRNTSGGVAGAVFYFPRTDAGGTPTVSPNMKQVDFYLLIVHKLVLTSFDPQRMRDRFGADL
jgi:hypothetical protein